MKHQYHEQHLPFTVNSVNQFSDLTAEEFMNRISSGAIVPEAVMSPSESTFSVRSESVSIVDKVKEELP